MGRGRHRGALRRSAVVLAALVLGTLAGGGVSGAVAAGTADGIGGVNVTIKSPGGSKEMFLDTPGDLTPAIDVTGVMYQRRVRQGDDAPPTSESGTSARTLAELAGITAANIRQMTITVPLAGAPIELSGSDVADGYPEDGTNKLRQVLFNGTRNPTGEVEIIRPLRNSSDTNGATLQPGSGVPVAVTIETNKTPLDISVTGPDKVESGKPATFQAVVPSGLSGPTVTWRLGDGSQVSGPTASRVYASDGLYNVRAFVTTADGSSGVGVATVRVGDVPATTGGGSGTPQTGANGSGGTPGAGTGEASAAPTGPDVGSGSAVDAPSNGANEAGGTTTPATPTDPARRTPPTSSSSARRQKERRAAKTTRASPTPTTPQVTRPANPSTATPDNGPRTPGGREKQKPRAGAADGTGGKISGVLVASRTAAVIPISPAEVARAAAARRGAEPKGTFDLGWVVGPLVVVGLLGAGAARELRPRRRTLTATRMPTT